MNAAPSSRDQTRGLWLGALGVLIFAMTLPMTRLAVGPLDAPQLPPAFVTAGRAAGAGLLSLVYLWLTGAPRPRQAQLGLLAVSALGTVLGFPIGLAMALREVPSMHAAVASASIGYVAGARLSAQWRAEHVISWVLVLSLPATLPVALWAWPTAPVRAAAWGAFGYVTVFSMWLGFFAWYRGLALGGALRVSQVQLIQPFLALLLAVPVLGEALTPSTLGFSLAVVAVVLVGKRMPVRAASKE